MSRLTQRDGDSYTYSEYAMSRDGSCCFGFARLRNEAIDKLGKLEDIEDELGIDLITLHKALKNGVYIKRQSQTTFPLALFRKDYSDNTTRYYVFNGKEIEIRLKDYGKTWALTKEELQ